MNSFRLSPSVSLTCDGVAGYRLLIASGGYDSTGGGLFEFDGSELRVIDRVSSVGLHDCSDRLARMLRSSFFTGGGELVIYDQNGVRQYFRVDELSDAHAFTFDGRNIVAASTGTNSVLWISLSGDVERVLRLPGEDDSWHINEVLLHDGRLYACAFGQHPDHGSYKQHMRSGHGFVFDLESGSQVLDGLCAPHSPRFLDGHWSVCNSMSNEWLQFDADGRTVRRRVPLAGFTRGVATCDDYVFIGESAGRWAAGPTQSGSVAVLSRSTLDLVARIPLPIAEVMDLMLASPQLAEGVRTSFRTNPHDAHEQDPLHLFYQFGLEPKRVWAVSNPLTPEQCRTHIEAAIPESFEIGKLALLDCVVENLSECFYSSTISSPVSLSYKWQRTERSPMMEHQEGLRRFLPCVLPPGGKVNLRMQVMPPPIAGEFRLILSLVQDGVCWFDEIDSVNACSSVVVVHERRIRQANPTLDRQLGPG